MKKICIALLVLLSLTACGSETSEVNKEDITAGESAAEETTESPYLDDLPTDLDFSGESVVFLYREDVADEFYATEEDGDVVNDALYASHRSVEERLNVKIEVVTKPGQNVEDRSTYMGLIRSSVMSGDDAYDWVDLMIGNAPVLMQEGLFKNLLDNEYIDPSKQYYVDGLADMCTIGNRLYFVSGDASLGYLKDSFCIFFNKEIARDYQLGSLYDLVDSGEWTIDKLIEISQSVCKDLNGDGVINDSDLLGFRIYDQNHLSGFIASTEFEICSKDNDGSWTFDMSSDRNAAIVEKLHELVYETDGSLIMHVTDCRKFVSDEVLFITAQFDDAAQQLRDMESEYGILPYPKYDAAQDTYYSNARTTHNSFSMPVTCGSPEMAGAVLEALSAENYTTVTPAYFELALKTKFASDDETAKMYDIIRGGMRLEFGYLFSNIMENPITNVYIAAIQKDGSLSSKLAANESKITEALEKYIETVQKMEE